MGKRGWLIFDPSGAISNGTTQTWLYRAIRTSRSLTRLGGTHGRGGKHNNNIIALDVGPQAHNGGRRAIGELELEATQWLGRLLICWILKRHYHMRSDAFDNNSLVQTAPLRPVGRTKSITVLDTGKYSQDRATRRNLAFHFCGEGGGKNGRYIFKRYALLWEVTDADLRLGSVKRRSGGKKIKAYAVSREITFAAE